MKLKYYLRGLGIGIVVTALIMGIALKDRRPLTDAEIKAAAIKLGMVESNSLKLTDLPQTGAPSAEPTGMPEPTPAATPSAEPTGTSEPTTSATPAETPEPTPAATPTETLEPTPAATPAETLEPTVEPESEGASGGADTTTITIIRGTGSRAVCSQLAAAGLIADAAAFDRYLVDGGYSTRIGAGTFEIPVGASEEEIAKIISRSR